ncbi:MAG TPA: FtsX-like permease family protein [Chthoniobacterales bacterium]
MIAPNVLRIFAWQIVRYAVRHRLLAVLNVASIALGVSVFLAIQIANHSANQALRASVDLVTGKATLEVRGPIDGALFPKIAGFPGVKAATPVVEGVVTMPAFPGEYLRILGVDPFTSDAFSTVSFRSRNGTQDLDLQEFLSNPHAVAIPAEFARKYGLKIGQTLDVLVNSRRVSLEIRSILETDPSLSSGGTRMAAMDIGFAQVLFGMGSQVSSIQVLADEDVAAEIRKIVPPTVSVASPTQRSRQVSQMLQSFQLNLTALSLVALLVGMFLVHNTVSASVVRRRTEIGILRSVGASRGQVRGLFLGEALLYGMAGLVLGIVGGVVLSNFLAATVSKTISSLYVLMSLDRVFVSVPQIILAVAVGLTSVLVAAWIPANEAATLPPVQALNPGISVEKDHGVSWKMPVMGLLVCALSVLCGFFSLQKIAWLGFASAFFFMAGCSLFAPTLVVGMSSLLQKLGTRLLFASLAAQNLRRSLGRTSLTVAALATSIAMMIGVSVMIFSFRRTVDTWLGRSLVADLFVSPASNASLALGGFLPPDVASWFEERPEVKAVDTFRQIQIPFHGETIWLEVVRGYLRDNLRFLERDDRRRNGLLFETGYVLISEPFGRRFGLGAGDAITLPTPKGDRVFEIGGTYYDYTSDEGNVLMSRENFDFYWDDLRIHSVAVYLKERAETERVADAFRLRFAGIGEFSVLENRAIRERIFNIFDQTFAITSLLRVIAIIVAIAGIILTLSMLVTERVRDLAVLRAIGAGRDQIRRLILVEAALIGGLSSILGLITGAGLAVILTFVVNKAFFGWTIQLAWPWILLAATPFWLIPVALAAGWLPAWRAARLPLAPALRNE